MIKRQGAITLRVLGLSMLLCCLCGCMKIGPDYTSPDVSDYHLKKWVYAQDHIITPHDEELWWKKFDDPELNRLIKLALEKNITLAIAVEDIAILRAYRGVSASNLYPSVSLGGYGIRVRSEDKVAGLIGAQPGTQKSLFAGAALAGWELDFWGRVQRLVENADYNILSAEEALGAAVLTLTSELAKNYIALRATQESLRLLETQLQLQQQKYALSLARKKNGIGTKQELLTVKDAIKQTAIEQENLIKQIAITKNNIAILTGVPPQLNTVLEGQQLKAIQVAGSNIPAEVLSRRPDVRKAEFHYAAANANIGAAMAERYPSIALGGVLSFQGDSLNHLFRADRLAYIFGTGITIPIFTGGQISSAINVRKSQAEQAKLQLQQVVLGAVKEVESCAVSLDKYQKNKILRVEQVEIALEKKQLTQELYNNGLRRKDDVLDTKLNLIIAHQYLTEAKQLELIEIVNLYKALGGGWYSSSKTPDNEVTQ